MANHPSHSAHDHHDHDHPHDHAPATHAPRINLIALSGFQRLLMILPLILALWLATFWAIA